MSSRLPLEGKVIAFLATDHFEQSELTEPWHALKDAGAEAKLVSLNEGAILGRHHTEPGNSFKVDCAIDHCSVADFDGLVLPGGVHNPDSLRTDPKAVRFVKEFFSENKPVAAICHGPWLLVEADVVRDRELTSWPSLRTDIKNAGGSWMDKAVVVDDLLVTSRKPDDLNSFITATIQAFADAGSITSESSLEKKLPISVN